MCRPQSGGQARPFTTKSCDLSEPIRFTKVSRPLWEADPENPSHAHPGSRIGLLHPALVQCALSREISSDGPDVICLSQSPGVRPRGRSASRESASHFVTGQIGLSRPHRSASQLVSALTVSASRESQIIVYPIPLLVIDFIAIQIDQMCHKSLTSC